MDINEAFEQLENACMNRSDRFALETIRAALAELGTSPNKPSAKLLRCPYFGNEFVYKCSRGDKLGWCDRCAE